MILYKELCGPTEILPTAYSGGGSGGIRNQEDDARCQLIKIFIPIKIAISNKITSITMVAVATWLMRVFAFITRLI